MRRGFFFMSILCWFAHGAFAAEVLKTEHVEVHWLAPDTFGPEETTIAIRFKLKPGWHVYWKNPGDSGAAPKFQFSTNTQTPGLIQWPAPRRIAYGSLVNLGYEEDVSFPLAIRPANATVQITAKLEWLVCQEECTPEFGTLTLSRPVVPEPSRWHPEDRADMDQALTRIPAANPPLRITSAHWQENSLLITVSGDKSPEALEIYPLNRELISPHAPTQEKTAEGWRIGFQTLKSRAGLKTPRDLATGEFVLTAGGKAWQLAAVPITQPALETAIWILFLSAFLGGMILNLMPCVFPVLFIKIYSVLKSSPHAHERAREGLAYTSGVVTTFASLGAVFLLLRRAGSAVGWGFQLQSPLVVLSLILLFWLLALNFLGVFEWGIGVMNLASRRGQSRPGEAPYSSAFATGILSVFVAAPCTGPFMGTALGAAATLPALSALMIFVSLGLGLALPFLALTFFPRALDGLPRPGAWMETLKQALAFPLFGTVLWLLWVLGRQTGDAGWLLGSSVLLATAFYLWLGKKSGRSGRMVLWIVALLHLGWSLNQVRTLSTQPVEKKASTMWADYDPELIAAAKKQARPIFIDFTAAWCITCQLNKKAVLETEAAEKIFRDHHVALFRGDWTNQDARITEALAAFGRSSVPLYVFYNGGSETPQILPQILTLSTIESLFSKP